MPSNRLKRVDPGPKRRSIALRRKLLFATAICFTFFALLEIVLWGAGVATLVEEEDPFRGFSGLVTVFQRDGEVYRTRRGAVGNTFNDQSFLVQKPTGSMRFFCLGGSSSFGFPWGAEAAFTDIFGEALAASQPKLHVEAVNASGISYAMHRLNVVADELLKYEPDVFIVYSGHNEFIEPAFFDALKHRSAVRTWLEYVLAHSRTYSGMRTVLDRLGRKKQDYQDYEVRVWRDTTRAFSQQEKKAIVAEYRWRLERLIHRAQEAGVKVLLATVPCNLREWRPYVSTTVATLNEEDRRMWSDAFHSGRRRLKGEDFEAATADLVRAASLAPDHAETQFLLGQGYEALGRWNDARESYQRACDADASPQRRISGINEAIRDVGHQDGVIVVDVDRIFQERSEHGLVGFNLIEDYVHPTRKGHEIIAWHMWDAMEQAGWLGDKKRAERALFDRIIAERQRRPITTNATWLFNQGVVLQQQGRTEAAIEKFREALVINPNYVGALSNLGLLLNKTGQYTEAVGVLERAIQIAPDYASPRFNLGNSWLLLGRFEEAIAHFDEAIRLRPEHAEARANMGVALKALGRVDDAVAHYQEAIRINPDYATAHNNLGDALKALGRVDDAVARYQEAVRINRDFAKAHHNLAEALVSQGDFAAAMKHFREVLRIQPDDAAAHTGLGVVLGANGDYPNAVRHFEQALARQPNYLVALDNLAWIRATHPDPVLRNGADAVKLAQRVCKLTNYQSAFGLDALAAAYAESGQFDEAVRSQEKAVRLAPAPQQAGLRERLALYQQGKPFRETSK